MNKVRAIDEILDSVVRSSVNSADVVKVAFIDLISLVEVFKVPTIQLARLHAYSSCTE